MGLLLGPPFGELGIVSMASSSRRLLLIPRVGASSCAPLAADEGVSELPVSVGQIISDACPHHPSRLLQ